MTATIFYDDDPVEAPAARTEGGRLWLDAADLARATRWELKPEGMCRDEVCIPIPDALAASIVREDGGERLVDLTGFAGYLNQPYAHDEEHDVWLFGESADEARTHLLALEAPDFTLPAYDGKTYSLSAFRDKKVFLLLWSSW